MNRSVVFANPDVHPAMKQGDRFIRLVMLLLAAVCLSYFGAAAAGRLSAPLTTVTALEVWTEDSADTVGILVRDEILLTSACPVVVPLLAEGEKAAAGQALAIGMQQGDAEVCTAAVADLHRRLGQLVGAEHVDSGALHGEIRAALTALARNPNASGSYSNRLKGLILYAYGDEAVLEAEKAFTVEQLNALNAQRKGMVLTAKTPGWFSSFTDGFEQVLTPDFLNTMTADALYAQKPGVWSRFVYGKLIRSETWYYVTVLPYDRLNGVTEGAVVAVYPNGMDEIPMRAERIDLRDPERCLLVLSSDRHLDAMAALRRYACKVVFRRQAGIQIPRSAVCRNAEGQSGVYVLEGAAARWKPIVILRTDENNCIAALDRSDTDNLWPGDEILVANNLYDGKVVYP